MGYRELIDALRKEGEEKIRDIWQAAEGEAKRVREEAFKRIEKMKEEYNDLYSSTVRRQTENIILEAVKRERRIKASIEKELSDRLYNIALKSLYLLRDKRYGDVFDALFQELPKKSWKTVRVNLEDEEFARRYFPDSEIILDSRITGGLEVTGMDGMIRIVNTFEKRLERVWMEIVPEIIKETRSLMHDVR